VDIDIRRIGPDRYDEAYRMLAASFGEELHPQELEAERPIFATGQNLAAFDGDAIVGLAGAMPMELTVPGGRFLGTGGVTSVGVLPTHRRRGVGSALMRRQLEGLHEQEVPTAYLWASEGSIYQRFGYGLGSVAAAFEIDREDTGLLHPVEPAGRMRLIEQPEAMKVFPSVYERVRPTRPGMTDRDEHWWNAGFLDIEAYREGASPYFYAAYETAEGLDGYVVYRVKESRDHRGGFENVLAVEELLSATDDAYAGLWRYCFGVDLVGKVTGWKRPVDEPLLHMLTEPRRLGLQIRDGTWLRLVDVGTALEGRGYGAEDRLVLGIDDGFCAWNDGEWELDGGADGASCRRTDRQPDLVLDASTVACAYLGAVPLRTLARAGRVEERTAGALNRGDAMFASDPAPWCAFVF
jgi:predicted acetyltransferase